MTEGDQSRTAQDRTPAADDDRPTSQLAPVSGHGSDGERRSAGGRVPRSTGPQPSASGWTPPPLPGRQTPEPRTSGAAAAAATSSASGSAPAESAPAGPTPAAGSSTGSGGGSAPSTTSSGASAAGSTAASAAEGSSIGGLWQKVAGRLGIESKEQKAEPSAPVLPELTSTTAAEPTSRPVATSHHAAAVPAPPQQQRLVNRAEGSVRPVTAPVPTPTTGTLPVVRSTASGSALPVAAATGGASAGAVETLATVPVGTAAPAKPSVRRTRKARLRLSRLDPWSVMKTAFLFSIAAGIMLVVAVYAVWAVLSGSGLFDSVNEIIASVVATPGDTTPFQVEDYLNTQRIMGVTALLASIDVLIFTALATLGSFLYNLAATMLGGLEITLAED